MSYSYRRPPQRNHARLSNDHGRTWSNPIVLSGDGAGDLSYPSAVELPGGQLLNLVVRLPTHGLPSRSTPTAPLLRSPPRPLAPRLRFSL